MMDSDFSTEMRARDAENERNERERHCYIGAVYPKRTMEDLHRLRRNLSRALPGARWGYNKPTGPSD